MNDQKRKSFFKELDNKEFESKLAIAARKELGFTLWAKGQSQKLLYKATGKKSGNQIYLNSLGSEISGDILFTFSINGLPYFGSGSVDADGKLEVDKKLFKSERRKNFRLLTYPVHKVFIQIYLEKYLNQSNVVDFKMGVSETKLFKNFLNLIGENEDKKVRDGYVALRVQDLSATGLSFIVSPDELEYFDEEDEIGEIYLNFNNEELKIPNAKVIHIIDHISSSSRAYKVGLKFLAMDTGLDLKLSKKINDFLRDFESEFEDFLK